MKYLIISMLVLLFSSVAYADIKINEVMYDPEGNDNNKEYVEIYSDYEINLSEFIIGDNTSNDSLELLSYYDSDYYLIVEDGYNISFISASVYSAGATIGNNLNTEDSLFLYYKNGTLADSMTYADECSSGYSLEYLDGDFSCSFYLGGTPGIENSVKNQDYSNLAINELFPDPAGEDNSQMPNGEFVEVYNKGDVVIDMSGMYFVDLTNHKLYVSDTTTISGTIIYPKGYLVVYVNGFSGFLNNLDFEEIKLYDPNGNLVDKVSYGSSTEALSWSLVNNIWQERIPSPNERNFKEEVTRESYFEIEGLEDVGASAEFGDTIKVRFNVYKGDTTKSSIKLYIEDDENKISKITKASLSDKFTNYSLTLPLQIIPNCDGKIDDGDFYVKIGWTAESSDQDSYEVKVKGINMDNCEKVYVTKDTRKGTLDYKLMELPANIEVGKEFNIGVELANNGEEDLMVDLSSYVYRGSKCYSSSREGNMKKVLVKSLETKQFEIKDIVPEAEPGEYNIKIKVKRDDQKTEKELTETINVLASSAEVRTETLLLDSERSAEDNALCSYPQLLSNSSMLTCSVVYESTSVKSGKLVAPFLIITLAILCIFLVFKKVQ